MAKIMDYRIVISNNATMNERRAAVFLGKYIRLITGKKPETVTDDTVSEELELVIGKTKREEREKVIFERSRERLWEYEIRTVGKKVYLTGLGIAPEEEVPYNSAYKLTDDGGYGTVLSAYRFVEDVLGFDFIYENYEDYKEDSGIEIPDGYTVSYTKEALRAELPKLQEGTALYVVPSCQSLNWNMCCLIFQTCSGKLVVVDGGHLKDAEHVLDILEYVAQGKKPVVTAWLFSHLHEDHYGVYKRLCDEPALRERVTVEHFYSHLLPENFYRELSCEAGEFNMEPLHALKNSDKTVGARLHTVEKGEVIAVDELSFEVIHVPDMAYAEKMNMNDSSVVYKLTHDSGQTMMLLGDAEFVCSNDLTENARNKLKSDVVQVGHHGCGNVSEACYHLIDAKVYLWQIGNRFWYSDSGEGLNTHNTGVIRTRNWIMQMGVKRENNYRDTNGILSLSLPLEIK